MSDKPFTFICGPDDFLVDRLGKERYAALTKDIDDEFSQEVLSGFANNVSEVETAINHFRDSVQTVLDVRRTSRGVVEGRQFSRR